MIKLQSDSCAKHGTATAAVSSHNIQHLCFQFFLTMGEELDYLDGVHTVFGEVSEGFDVLEKLNEVIVDQDNRPYRDVR